jgi:hypothetical protein
MSGNMPQRRSSRSNKSLTRSEKLRFVLEWKFPNVDYDDVEQIERAPSQGQDLETAIEAVVKQYADDDEIDEDDAEDDAQFAEALKAALAFKAEERSDAQLNALYREAQAAEERKRRISDLARREEFVRDPKTAADFSFWRLRAYWNLREAATLCFGKDPRKVRLELSPLSRQYREVLELLRRAAEAEKIGRRNQVHPALLIAWGKKVGLKYAPEIETVVLAGNKARKSTQTKSSQIEELNAKDLSSLYRMVLGMAMSKYGFDHHYDPKIGSSAFAHIVHDLDNVGIPITVKPVREHILDALAHAKQKALKLKKAPQPRS